MIATKGKASFRHAETAEVYEIHADQVDFEFTSVQERNMGPETEHSAEVDHPKLGLIRWTLWEYPMGIVNLTETDHDPHELLENFSFELQDEQSADYDD
ncbi:MAG: hypothetical protein F4Y34_13855 [Gammaproteobacteria bacterium]|nr:hypothetical protein [Gammaproteobacteria bacterium]MYH85053.1 hypothetical protein [Gammaproteobacteria bacterium]